MYQSNARSKSFKREKVPRFLELLVCASLEVHYSIHSTDSLEIKFLV